MALPEEFEERFRSDLFEYEKESHMPWLSSIERSGFEKGMEKGIEKGIEKGMRQGLLEGIAAALEARFGLRGRKMLAKVRTLPDVAALRRFNRFMKTAKDFEQVCRYFE